MNKKINSLIGILLQIDKKELQETFPKLKKEWFITEQEISVYEMISEMIISDVDINLVSISANYLKQGKRKMAIFCSDCLSSVNVMLWYNVEKLIEIIKFDFVSSGAKNTLDKLHNLMQSEMDFDKYIEILNLGIKQFNDEMIINEDTINTTIKNVIERHDLAKTGDIGGILLGFPKIDSDIILEPVDLMVIGARPAMGKTSFGVALLTQMAFHEKRKVVYFNLEMSNQQLMRRIIANLTGIDSNKIKKGECNNEEMRLIHQVILMPEMNNIILYEGSHTIPQIKMKLTQLKYANKVDVFIVDYLQKISAIKGKTRYEQVTEVCNGLKYISQNMKIPSIAFAQLGREAGKTGNRPILPDLRESGEIEQDASIVAFLHRPEYYGNDTDSNGNNLQGCAEFIVAKNREGDTPIIEFSVDLKTSVWTEKSFNNSTFVNMAKNKKLPF